jgi:hypothetical protein
MSRKRFIFDLVFHVILVCIQEFKSKIKMLEILLQIKHNFKYIWRRGQLALNLSAHKNPVRPRSSS